MTPAPKKKPPVKRPAKRPTRAKGPRTPGPLPLILKGFDRRMLRPEYADRDPENVPDPWTEHAPARRCLMALRAGATATLAAQFAKVHPHRLNQWNTRGKDATADEEDLAALEATGLDDETLACAAYYVLAQQAEAMPGIGALTGISRATPGEWRAGIALLRILPATKREYSEVQKLEHSGPDGDAIPVEVRAKGLSDVLRARLAASAEGADPGDDPDQVEPDTAGEG